MPTTLRHPLLDVEDSWPLLFAPYRALAVLLIAGVVGVAYAAVDFLIGQRLLLWPEEMAWIGSQKPPAQRPAPLLGDETVVTLKRDQCYGGCPIYELKLYGSGRVEFRGEAYVCETSPQATRVDREQVKRLVDGMVAAGFHRMRSETEFIPDAPVATVTLAQGQTAHVVKYMYYDPARSQRVLPMIAQRIQEVAGAPAWVGIERRFRHLCPMPDGSFVPIEKLWPNYSIG